MPEKKYEKYVITEISPELASASYDGKPKDIPPGGAARLFWIDDYVAKGSFHVQCVWCLKASDGSIERAHTHDFDEVISFLGTDPEHPYDLGGEIEIWLDDEKYVINKSCLVFVPKGLKHCPLSITRMDRPFLHFVATSSKLYDQK
jgi:hypothetical protein